LRSPESPDLYQLRTVLYVGGKIVDESVFKSGIRTLKFDANNGFALNGSQFNQPVSGGYGPKKPSVNRLGPIGKRLSGDIRAIDTSRPVTGALAGVIMTNETDYPKYLDVVGYNYTEDRYAIDHKKFPDRILYGSENGHSYAALKAVRDNDFIFGQFIWTGFD